MASTATSDTLDVDAILLRLPSLLGAPVLDGGRTSWTDQLRGEMGGRGNGGRGGGNIAFGGGTEDTDRVRLCVFECEDGFGPSDAMDNEDVGLVKSRGSMGVALDDRLPLGAANGEVGALDPPNTSVYAEV